MIPRIGCAPLNWSSQNHHSGWTNSVGEDHDGIQQMIGVR